MVLRPWSAPGPRYGELTAPPYPLVVARFTGLKFPPISVACVYVCEWVCCSVAHTTMYKVTNSHRYYTAHLIVLSVRPTYRVVYVSDSLRVHSKVYRAAPMMRPRYIDDGFIFPVGLIVENDDSVALGVHVNDHSSVILRLKGLKTVMDRIIGQDRRRGSKRGPPVGDIQQHIHDILVNETHVPLLHKH